MVLSHVVSEQKSQSSQQKQAANIDQFLRDKTFQLWKPLVVTMSLFGLLFLNGKSRKWYVVTRVYSTAVLLLLWGTFLRMFFCYRDIDNFGGILFLKISVHLWTLLSCVAASVTYEACHAETHVLQLFSQWSMLLNTNRRFDLLGQAVSWNTYKKNLMNRFCIFLVITWISFIANCILRAYLIFNTDRLDDCAIAPVPLSSKFVMPMKFLFYVAQIYMSAAWLFTLCLFFMIAELNYREFEIFLEDFKKAIVKGAEAVELEFFRRRHQAVSQMLVISDGLLRVFNAAGIVFSTCNGMLTLYWLVSRDSVLEDPVVFAAKIVWLFSSVVYLVVISIGGGYLNHVAHAPLKLVHNIRIKDVSLTCSLQINMFLNKLTGESMGLTAMDMFVIDKPTILTITGAFITYFIVLIQFKQAPSTPVEFVCNCTGI